MSQQRLNGDPAPDMDVSKERLEGLMLIRVVLVTIFLGSALAIEYETLANLTNPRNLTLLVLIVTTYLLTIVYAVLHRQLKSRRGLAIVQIALDVVIVGVLTTATGGLNSTFTFLFYLNIINAAAVLGHRASLWVATGTAGLFIWLALPDLGLIRIPLIYPVYRPVRNTAFLVGLNIAAAYLIAALAGLLAARLGQATEAIAQQQLDIEELRNLNRNILQSLSSGLVTVDETGEIIFFNRAAEEITGRESDDVLGNEMNDIFPELVSEQDKPVEDGQRRECRFVRPDGTELFLGFSLSSLRDRKGRTRGRILIFQDLSDIRQLELEIRRAERLAAVGQLSASIAHEIRNPLASISGAVELLELDDQDSTQLRLRDVVLREVDRLNRLISQFLEYSRPHHATIETIPLNDFVDDTLSLARVDPRLESVDIEVDIEDSLAIRADTAGLRQVLLNLIINASECEPAADEIKISSVVGERKTQLVVEDNGPGIPEEHMERIFDPFFTTKPKGSGLGLATAFRLIDDMNGRLSVGKSSALGGACFEIELPLAQLPSSRNMSMNETPSESHSITD